jgi:hypothetical protein
MNGIHQEPRLAEPWRLEDKVHHHAQSHLDDDQDTDDAANAILSSHSALPNTYRA